MGISEEIKVATMANDQNAIPIEVDNASRAVTAKKSGKKCAARSEFCFAHKTCCFSGLLVSVVFAVALSSLVALPLKTTLDMRRLCLTRNEIEVRR